MLNPVILNDSQQEEGKFDPHREERGFWLISGKSHAPDWFSQLAVGAAFLLQGNLSSGLFVDASSLGERKRGNRLPAVRF